MAGADTVNGSKYKFAASEVVSTATTLLSTNCEEKVGNFSHDGEGGSEGQGRTKEGLSKGRVYTLRVLNYDISTLNFTHITFHFILQHLPWRVR